MRSALYTLNSSDFINGLVTAVFTAIFATFYGVVTTAGFSIFNADWKTIGITAANAAVLAMVGYLGKKFFTAQDGTIAGMHI